jgi:hypothetical protein
MSKYYCLVAGLPNISLDDSKVPFTISEFRAELEGILTSSDKKLIDLFFLKFDNKNLIEQLLHPDYDPDERGSITYDEFMALFKALKKGKKPPKNEKIPSYFAEFFKLYIKEEGTDEEDGIDREDEEDDENAIPHPISWEDRLSGLYYAYAMKCKNDFFAQWYELNLNINNILTAITAKKYGLNKTDYIVGDNAIAQLLRTSNAKDFDIGDSLEYLPDLQRIAEEADLYVREKKIDQLKWEWLENNTFFTPFDIESVFAYLLKVEMIERWMLLDKAKGEKTFRELIGAMKKGSDNALEEFKRNNKK